MDQAIYEPTTQKIFGVRGQWLFQFNSASGALEQSVRFASDVGGISTITAFSGNLYIGAGFTPSNNLNGSPPFPNRDIYIVNAASFSVTGRFNLGIKVDYNFIGAQVYYYGSGWRSIVNSGGNILGAVGSGDLFTVDPSNIPGYARTSFGNATDIAVDSTNGVLWITKQADPAIYCVNISPFNSNSCSDSNLNLNGVTGICYNAAQNKVYAVDGTFSLLGFDATLAMPGFNSFLVSSFNTGRINANPQRVKSVNNQAGNPHNGKVLIPTWYDDAVVIWDPATDTVSSTLTGFTAPIDIVVCPTTNWAVQSGTVGLKQIT